MHKSPSPPGAAPPPVLRAGFARKRRGRKGARHGEEMAGEAKGAGEEGRGGRYEVPGWTARRPLLSLDGTWASGRRWAFRAVGEAWGAHAYRCPTCVATGTSLVAWLYYALFGPPLAMLEDEVQLLRGRKTRAQWPGPSPDVARETWDQGMVAQEFIGQMAWRRPVGPHPGAPMYDVQLYCDAEAVRQTYRGTVIQNPEQPPEALARTFAHEMGIAKSLKLHVCSGMLTPKVHASSWNKALHDAGAAAGLEWSPATALAAGFFCRQFEVAPCWRGTEILLLVDPPGVVRTVIGNNLYGTITDPSLAEAVVAVFLGERAGAPRDRGDRPGIAFTAPLAALATQLS